MVSVAEFFTRRSFVTSDGVKLSFIEAGAQPAGSGDPTIVLVPGWSMPASLWRKQLEELGHRYRTLALDPRGQGESDVPPKGFTAERRATDIQEFLQPHSNVVLVGWSLSAIGSLQYIFVFDADRLAGLVLVDSSVGEDPAPPPGGTFIQRLRKDRDAMLREFVPAIFAKPHPNSEINALVRSAKRIPLADSVALLSYPFERTHWKKIVHSFPKPLLYIVTPQFEGQAKNLRKNRPTTQVEFFRNGGHALFVDEPERFNGLITQFAENLNK